MLIVDEFAYSKPELFKELLVPILMVEKSAFIGLSSPADSLNHMSKLMKATYEGRPFFKIVDCNLVCESCRLLPTNEEKMACTHVKNAAPWLDKNKGNKYKTLYEDDPATALRELYGMVADGINPCFDKELLNDMFNGTPYVCKSAPSHIFVSMDFGGGASQTAMNIGYWNNDAEFVVSPNPER